MDFRKKRAMEYFARVLRLEGLIDLRYG